MQLGCWGFPIRAQKERWGLPSMGPQWRIQGGVGGLTPPPPSEVLFLFFCLSVHVYENSRRPGPYPPPFEEFLDPPLVLYTSSEGTLGTSRGPIRAQKEPCYAPFFYRWNGLFYMYGQWHSQNWTYQSL